MIERITIENFKSLKKVDLKLGRLNIFIGTNASGKSNFFDALRVLQGMADGRSVAQVFTSPASGGERDGIRGGIQNALFRTKGDAAPVRQGEMSIQVCSPAPPAASAPVLAYEIAFDTEAAITREVLKKDGKVIFEWHHMEASHFRANGVNFPFYPNPFESSQLVLAYRTEQFQGPNAKEQKDVIKSWKNCLESIQFLAPDPQILRRYGKTPQPRRIGEYGEDFASVVAAICTDVKAKKALLSWLKELTPVELEDVGTRSGADNDQMFMVNEKGREFTARVLSDGTLRFAAIVSAFLFRPPAELSKPGEPPNEDPPRMLAIEEIENGIHGSRLRLLVELLRNQAATTKTQVFATTHSPLVLAWLTPDQYETTFYCKRDEVTGESSICPVTQIPHFNEIIRKQSIGDLFAEGWMEAAL